MFPRDIREWICTLTKCICKCNFYINKNKHSENEYLNLNSCQSVTSPTWTLVVVKFSTQFLLRPECPFTFWLMRISALPQVHEMNKKVVNVGMAIVQVDFFISSLLVNGREKKLLKWIVGNRFIKKFKWFQKVNKMWLST